jgi:hypothetical protein
MNDKDIKIVADGFRVSPVQGFYFLGAGCSGYPQARMPAVQAPISKKAHDFDKIKPN